MTTEEIQKRLDKIKSTSGDPEEAHFREDRLCVDFIRYISTIENTELAAKAKLVLSSRRIGFQRWYS
jgi:hypothetical protein